MDIQGLLELEKPRAIYAKEMLEDEVILSFRNPANSTISTVAQD